jgi:aryl-alcohol dehydrogenase-like predicted oxidoreductase
LAQGILTGKFGPDHQFEKGDHRSKNRLFQNEHYERAQEALKKLRSVAQRNNITLAQLALAWVVSHSGTCAIAGARNAGQSVENAQAGNIILSKEDLAEMDTIGRSVSDHLDDNPVLWKW